MIGRPPLPLLFLPNMKSSRLLPVLLLFAAVSCGPKTGFKLSVSNAPGTGLAVYRTSALGRELLDSVSTDKSGKVSYKIDIKKGEPEFVYVSRGDYRIASLLLSRGETAVVVSDTLAQKSVSGSPESELLLGVERDYADFVHQFSAAKTASQANKVYIDYYRGRTAYVLSHPYSLTIVPVLYQKIGGVSVFNAPTDAILFRRAVDSLKTVYPKSSYVKALEQETLRREKQMQLDLALRNAKVAGFPDIVLPDTAGEKKALSGVDAKVIVLHFWDVSDPDQTLYNIEILQPLYRLYKDRGMEIYSVCLSSDKTQWASVVRNQDLQWINVCDSNAGNSTLVGLYGITKLPKTLIIADGELVSDKADTADALQRAILKRLK